MCSVQFIIARFLTACIVAFSFGGVPTAIANAGMKELTGYVRDSHGKPVEGATIRVWELGNGTARETLADRQACDSEGRFRIRVTIERTMLVVAVADGFGRSWKRITEKDDTAGILSLTKEHSIAGKIVDDSGRPVRGAVISPVRLAIVKDNNVEEFLRLCSRSPHIAISRFHGDSVQLSLRGGVDVIPEVRTGDDGCFSLSGVAPDQMLRAYISGPEIASSGCWILAHEPVDAEKLPQPDSRLTPGPIGDYGYFIYGARFTHQARSTTPVHGVVRDQLTGAPLPCVSIECGFPWITTMTGEDGSYRLVGLPNGKSYVLKATKRGANGYADITCDVAIREPRDGIIHVDFSLLQEH